MFLLGGPHAMPVQKVCESTKYTLDIVDDIFCLVDLDIKENFIDNINNIINQLRREGFDSAKHQIIFKNSSGVWAWGKFDNNGFLSRYIRLATHDKQKAILKIKKTLKWHQGQK